MISSSFSFSPALSNELYWAIKKSSESHKSDIMKLYSGSFSRVLPLSYLKQKGRTVLFAQELFPQNFLYLLMILNKKVKIPTYSKLTTILVHFCFNYSKCILKIKVSTWNNSSHNPCKSPSTVIVLIITFPRQITAHLVSDCATWYLLSCDKHLLPFGKKKNN